MKNINKRISIFLVLTIVFVSICGFTFGPKESSVVTNTEKMSAEVEEKMFQEFEEASTVQKEALEAHEVLYSTFGKDENDFTIYPDDYAGAWIDGSKLYIALTSDDEMTVSKYSSLLKDFDCVQFQKAKYSLNELATIQDSTFEILKKDHDVVCFYTRVQENKIVFEIKNPNMYAVQKSLNSEMRLAKPFDVDLNKEIDATLFIIENGERIQSEANIYGGMPIERGSATGPTRTIGMCGTIIPSSGPSFSGIITAGHNLTTSGTDEYLYRDGYLFGDVYWLMYKDNGNGDWAAVKVTSGDTMTNKIYGSSSSYVRSITGTSSNPPVGTSIMKYGSTSGYATATVKATDLTIFDGTYTVKGLTKCELNTGSSAGGDSGGPYYVSGYSFAGVHQGSTGDNIYFTPYTRFSSYFTPKTN